MITYNSNAFYYQAIHLIIKIIDSTSNKFRNHISGNHHSSSKLASFKTGKFGSSSQVRKQSRSISRRNLFKKRFVKNEPSDVYN